MTSLCHPQTRGWSRGGLCLEPLDPERWRCRRGVARRVGSRLGHKQRNRLSSPPGPVVYLQPELFTSATGPDLRHGHTHTHTHTQGPVAPQCPQVPPGLCRGRRGRGDGAGWARADSWPHPAPHPAAVLPRRRQRLSPAQDPSPAAAEPLFPCLHPGNAGGDPQPQGTSQSDTLGEKDRSPGASSAPIIFLAEDGGRLKAPMGRDGWMGGGMGWMDGGLDGQTDPPHSVQNPIILYSPTPALTPKGRLGGCPVP